MCSLNHTQRYLIHAPSYLTLSGIPVHTASAAPLPCHGKYCGLAERTLHALAALLSFFEQTRPAIHVSSSKLSVIQRPELLCIHADRSATAAHMYDLDVQILSSI